MRSRFDPHAVLVAETIPVLRAVRACRDPHDDEFLEVAVNGRADPIVTGDRNPLEPDPFLGLGILTPAAYLAR